MTHGDLSTRTRRRSMRSMFVGLAAVIAGASFASSTPTASAVADDDWLAVVNTYRAMSGLDPVTSNATWSSQAADHSCYMLQNGISHDEIPGRPGYTSGGDVAGNSGNVAVSSSISATPRQQIDLWMTGPFHAIGILRHNLRTSGYGRCAQEDTPTPWRSGGTLDVIRGIDYSVPRPAEPVLFPGDGATIPLHSFVTEFPNPVEMCGWTGSAGLPLIAMMPNDVTSANASLSGPSGPIETCTLHHGNTSDPTAKAILGGDDAVVVVPRSPLADGTHTVTVNSSGGNVTWSFDVDRSAPLVASTPKPKPEPKPEPVPAAPDTKPSAEPTRFEPTAPFRLVDSRERRGTARLRAESVTRIRIGDSNVKAVSANFVAVDPDDFGFVTAYNCTDEPPDVSTLGFRPHQVVANQAVVPLDDGVLCLYASVGTDIIVDVNGHFRSDADSGFTPAAPERLLDTRSNGERRLRVREERRLTVAGSGQAAPGTATSVALNVTVTGPDDHGWLQVYPCGAPASAEISTINYIPDAHRPNSVVVPVDASGRICLRSLRGADVVVDYTGYFADNSGYAYTPLMPIRLFDSRVPTSKLNRTTDGQRLEGGQVVRLPIAGSRGIPADATAVSVNVTATEAQAGSFVTVYPCGKRPQTSNVNIIPAQGVAVNGAMVKLSGSGELCVFTLNPLHLIVDISGVYA